ncbi:hypothetical protein NHX12_002676, partial [Muraenolepis orangiensis]
MGRKKIQITRIMDERNRQGLSPWPRGAALLPSWTLCCWPSVWRPAVSLIELIRADSRSGPGPSRASAL